MSHYILHDRPSPDYNNVTPTGLCAHGHYVYHHELKKQMIWAGNQEIWNGQYVCEDCYDRLNYQDGIPPITKPDPEAIQDPRPFKVGSVPPAPRNLILLDILLGFIPKIACERIKGTDYYIWYWKDSSGYTYNSFDAYKDQVAPPMTFPEFLSMNNADPNNIQLSNCKRGQTYLVQLASMNNLNQPLHFKGNYKYETDKRWSYNISQPTNIQYALTVTTQP